MTEPSQVNKTAVIAVGDMHIGSTVAVCTPTVNLDDGGTYSASPGQRWLWRNWLDFWEQMKTTTEGYRRVVVLNGDIGELDSKARSWQTITRNKSTLLTMALNVLQPALEIADQIFIIRGTEAHAGKSAWIEEALAQDLNGRDTPASHWHLRFVASGVRFDVAHHANMGRLPHTEKNAANKVSALIRWHYMTELEAPPPHVVLRSHVHRWSDSGKNYDTLAITMPAWTLKTAYNYRINAENGLASIGGVYFLCEGGRYEWDRVLYEPREDKKPWTMKV